jgi:dipeptidyl-peptidase III
MITALHELIGHGSGKLLTKNIENGETNYPIDLVNPITGEPIKNPYGTNETFNQRFKKLASAFEESRAEAVAFYFLFMNDTWPLFYPGRQEEWSNMLYSFVLRFFMNMVRSINLYDPKNNTWGQAHIQGYFAII